MRLTLTLPLLTKELTEQSARRRTFIVRTVYAVLLYGGAMFLFGWRVGWQDGSFTMIGTGGRLFENVLYFQLAAVYGLVPVLTAGVLTSEKERDTLGLLLITRLGPWTIVLEKYLSRVIPMLFYLLMSLPLLAVAYSLGGVDNGAVLRAGIAVTVCVLQVAALAVFCSAWCRTTSQALVLTYVLIGILFFCSRASMNPNVFTSMSAVRYQATRRILPSGQVVYYPPVGVTANPLAAMGNPSVMREADLPLSTVGAIALAAMAQVLLTLTLARLALWPRAFIRPKNRVLKLLQFLDGVFHQLNQNRFTKGKILIRDHVTLPLDRPIAWRETSRRSFGTTRYLVRLLLAIEVPLLFWLIVPLTVMDGWSQFGNHMVGPTPGQIEQWVVWWLGTMLILAHSTSLIAGERSRQTLDVLLSTPLSPRDIVRQKMAGLWRLMIVLAVPYGTAVFVRVWWTANTNLLWAEQAILLKLLFAMFAVAVYWPLIALVGFECGLWCRTQLQALSVALCIVLAVAALPYIIQQLPIVSGDWWFLVQPLVPFTATEPPRRFSYYGYEQHVNFERWLYSICAHTAVTIGAIFLLWRLMPLDFARAVRRCESPS